MICIMAGPAKYFSYGVFSFIFLQYILEKENIFVSIFYVHGKDDTHKSRRVHNFNSYHGFLIASESVGAICFNLKFLQND